jgi:hypothetical protein
LTGEKLTEDQVADAVCQGACRVGLRLQNFTMFPVFKPFPHYAVLAEVENSSDCTLLNRFLAEVDRGLGCGNVEYQSKRMSRRLGPLELWILPAGSYAALKKCRVAAGTSDAQIKLPCLTRDPEWHQQFDIVKKIVCELSA